MLDQARLLAVVGEIEARSPEFFEANTLRLNGDELGGALEDVLPVSGAASVEALRDTVASAWESAGLRWEWGPAPSDPIAQELLRAIPDTRRGDLPLDGDATATDHDVEQLLSREYACVRDDLGAPRGFIRKRGGKPLLVLNALGLPIGLWSRLLRGDHDHRLIVPVLPSCDLVSGGMTRTMSATEVAESLHGLLADLALPEVDVLAWCNAGRIGAALLREAGDTIGRLVLLSPTFRGGATPSNNTSAYEDSLHRLFALVSGGPGRAERTAVILGRPQPAPDWELLSGDPVERAYALFSMPRKGLESELKAPMASSDSLVHYVARTYIDEALTADMQAGLPGQRITLIQGSHDSVVSNLHTNEWLEQHAPGYAGYEVSGAGHYIQDLQYPYLVHLLRRILVDRSGDRDLPARVRKLTGVGGSPS